MNKEMLLNSFENSGATVAEIYKGGGGEQRILPKSFVINMVEKLDEPEITEAQAWETLAPRFSMSATELQRQVLDGFLAMTAEEIELESDKIKKLADGIKKLHAENEELKAKLDDPEKVVIPKFVADAFDYNKNSSEFLDWVRENPEDYVMAFRNSYEVEKEPLYYTVDEKGQTLLFKAQYRGIIRSNGADLETVLMVYEQRLSNMYQLTEKEIKDYDHRYWAFAQPVEDEEE